MTPKLGDFVKSTESKRSREGRLRAVMRRRDGENTRCLPGIVQEMSVRRHHSLPWRTTQLSCAVKYDYSVDVVAAYNVRENKDRLQ